MCASRWCFWTRSASSCVIPRAPSCAPAPSASMASWWNLLGEEATQAAAWVLWDIDSGSSENTAKLVRELGGRAQTYTVDVTNKEDVYRCAELVRQDHASEQRRPDGWETHAGLSRWADGEDHESQLSCSLLSKNYVSEAATLRKIVPECGSRTTWPFFNLTFLDNYSQKTSQRYVIIVPIIRHSYNEDNEQNFWNSVTFGLTVCCRNVFCIPLISWQVWLLHKGWLVTCKCVVLVALSPLTLWIPS